MEPGEDLGTRASELLEDARRFQSAAAQPGCSEFPRLQRHDRPGQRVA